MDSEKYIPPPPVLTHPVFNLVHILNLITEFNWVQVVILQVIHIHMQKVSVTYYIWFGFIHLACFLNSFIGFATHREKMKRLCVINLHRKNTSKVGDYIKHHRLHCYHTKKNQREGKWFSDEKYVQYALEKILLIVLNLLLSYHVNQFKILALVVKYCYFNRHPAL